MHFASSTTTGTEVGVLAMGMAMGSSFAAGSGERADALPVVGIALRLPDGDEIGVHGALRAARPAAVLAQDRVAEPVLVVPLRMVDTQVVQPPAALGAEQRG